MKFEFVAEYFAPTYSLPTPNGILANPTTQNFRIPAVRNVVFFHEFSSQMHMELMQIKAIALDAVGTVMSPNPPVAELYESIGQKYGSTLSAAEIAPRFRAAVADAYGAKDSESLQTNEVREWQRWEQIVSAVLNDVEDFDACFRELHTEFGAAKNWACFDDVGPTVEQLKASGLPFAIASNFDQRLHSVCDGHPALAKFPLRIVSTEVGFSKPAAEFYLAIADAFQVEPQHVLLVGDGFVNDYEGAIAAGLKALWLDRTGQNKGEHVIHSLTEILPRVEVSG